MKNPPRVTTMILGLFFIALALAPVFFDRRVLLALDPVIALVVAMIVIAALLLVVALVQIRARNKASISDDGDN